MNSVRRLQVLRFIHLWHKGLLPDVFDNMFQYASNIYGYDTRYSAERNLRKPKVRKILENSLSFAAIDIWKDLPSSLKDKRRLTSFLLRGKKEASIFSRQACFVNRYLMTN